jgi:hypothetical protein
MMTRACGSQQRHVETMALSAREIAAARPKRTGFSSFFGQRVSIIYLVSHGANSQTFWAIREPIVLSGRLVTQTIFFPAALSYRAEGNPAASAGTAGLFFLKARRKRINIPTGFAVLHRNDLDTSQLKDKISRGTMRAPA